MCVNSIFELNKPDKQLQSTIYTVVRVAVFLSRHFTAKRPADNLRFRLVLDSEMRVRCMSNIMLKLAAVWLVIILCGTVWFVIQLDKEDKKCISTCSALGKEAIFKEPNGRRHRIDRPAVCRCSE